MKNIFKNLRNKKLVWCNYIHIFTDGGQPKFRWHPVFMRNYLHPHWGMCGFVVYWLGREFNFVFGEDKNGLYKD